MSFVVRLALMALVCWPAPWASPTAAQAPSTERAWKQVPLAEWQPASAPNVMDLVAPAYRGYPESTEGKPGLLVELTKSKDGDGFSVTVTKQGLLDDAVGAEQVRLEIAAADGGGWRVQRAARRWQCRRGITAGQWTTSLCP